MKVSFITRAIAAGAAVMMASAGTASAQTQSFTDGSFASGWTSSVIVNPYNCSGGLNTPQSAGGNPGANLGTIHNTCGLLYLANMSPYSWNPSMQGAVTNLSYAYDVRSTGGGAVAFLTLVRQGGNYFVSKDYALGQNNGWTNFANANESLAAVDWCNVYTTFGASNSYVCGNAALDFSANGGQIDFGVASANSGGVYYTTGAIDNFDVDITFNAPPELDPPVTTTPEPGSFLLLASGIGAIAMMRRRRNRA